MHVLYTARGVPKLPPLPPAARPPAAQKATPRHLLSEPDAALLHADSALRRGTPNCMQAPGAQESGFGGGSGSHGGAGAAASDSQADSPVLSDEQCAVLELVRAGKNVFFTGKQGTAVGHGQGWQAVAGKCMARMNRQAASHVPPCHAAACPLAPELPAPPAAPQRRRCRHGQVLPAQSHHC